MTTDYETHEQAYDMGALIDLLLNANDVRKAFITRGSKDWVDRVSNKFLREGLKDLSSREIFIIENMVLRNKSVIDVCFELGIRYETFHCELKEIRRTLSQYL